MRDDDDFDGFMWRDGERTIRFGEDLLAEAPSVLAESGWEGYELLSTSRALGEAPAALAADASAVHEVPPGAVNEIAVELIGEIGSRRLVALGGGRVIDTAKAIGAATGADVAAIPTTLSGAPMTSIHKLPDGYEARDGTIRPSLVIADPHAMTAQPEPERRASAMNALAHAADSLYTPLANPVSRLTALEGARLIAAGLDDTARRADLAQGAILAGYAIDSARFSLHHVMCQSLVRVMRIPHAETNAAMLPRVVEALAPRTPATIDALAAALGLTATSGAPDLPKRIESLAGGCRALSDVGADRALIPDAVETMTQRPELQSTPDPPDAGELTRIVESAW